MPHRWLQLAGFSSVFVGIVLFCIIMGGYTSFWRSQNRIEAAKSLLTDACRERLDLLPALSEFAKKNKVAAPEIDPTVQKADTILQRVAAHKTPIEKGLIKEFEISQSGLTLQLKKLFPQLESVSDKNNTSQFAALKNNFFAVQNNLFITGKRYSDEVNYFNTRAITFPTSLFAKLFGFNKMEYLDISKDLFLPAEKTFAPPSP